LANNFRGNGSLKFKKTFSLDTMNFLLDKLLESADKNIKDVDG